jgi:hypothetical protein
MNQESSAVLTPLPKPLIRLLEPVYQELARVGEAVQQVRLGPRQPAAEFQDIEAVRLRLAREQRGQPWAGQVALVQRLQQLPADHVLTYMVLETAGQYVKCYCDPDREQLLGVLTVPQGESASGKESP